MLGIYVTVPVACFRKGMAREYLETERVPPPATCYGFLLSLVGETDRRRHLGARVAPVLLNQPAESVVLGMPTGRPINQPAQSVVLRTVWRVKKAPLGSSGNTRPDFQQLLTGPSREEPFLNILLWLDSTDESHAPPQLEQRVRSALDDPGAVSRFGGLSLGESTHLVDEVCPWDRVASRFAARTGSAFLTRADGAGRLTLPVWVDHVGSAGTRYAVGDLEEVALEPPDLARMPHIEES